MTDALEAVGSRPARGRSMSGSARAVPDTQPTPGVLHSIADAHDQPSSHWRRPASRRAKASDSQDLDSAAPTSTTKRNTRRITGPAGQPMQHVHNLVEAHSQPLAARQTRTHVDVRTWCSRIYRATSGTPRSKRGHSCRGALGCRAPVLPAQRRFSEQRVVVAHSNRSAPCL